MRPVLDLSQPQTDFVLCNEKFVGFTGGYRSGKTVANITRHLRLCNINQGLVSGFMEPTHAMLITAALPEWIRIFGEMGMEADKDYFFRKSNPMSFIIPMPGGNTTIMLGSAENYTRAAGQSWSHFSCDEFDLIDLETAKAAHRMFVSRLTKGRYKCGSYTCTPEGFNFLHWLFVEDANNEDGTPKGDRKLFIAPTATNPFLDDLEGYIDTMKSQYDPHLLQAYLEGKFVNLKTGSVYRGFDRSENFSHYVITPPNGMYDRRYIIPSNDPLIVGIDFNRGIMATAIMWIEPKTKDIHIVDEIFGQPDTQALILALRQRYPNRRLIVYPDSSGDKGNTNPNYTDTAMLRNAFGRDFVKSYSVNTHISDRVNAVNARILDGHGRRHLFVNVQKCPQVTKSLEQQTLVDGKPDKKGGLDHMADAVGYPIVRLFPIQSKHANTVKVMS